jgi:hypothetical protein
MVHRIAGRVVELSMHKFSSNLVEKCLLHGSDDERDGLVTEMLQPLPGAHPGGAGPPAPAGDDPAPATALNAMVKDQYANFVVGRAIEVRRPGRRAASPRRLSARSLGC